MATAVSDKDLKNELGYSLMCKLVSVESQEIQAMFPNPWKLACIALVLPTLAADCKRGFLHYQELKPTT